MASLAVLLLSSCIDNDLPYPVVPLEIVRVEGEGFTVKPSDIDLNARTVLLHLDETTDIRRVTITGVELTPGAIPSRELTGEFDLRTPLRVTLSLYQEYEWTLTAEQNIDLRFSVEGQIGTTEIDADNCIARVQVGEDADLKNIRVTELKLGPEGITTYTPSMEELTDFESIRYVEATCHGNTQRWMLSVVRINYTVLIAQTDLWQNTASAAIRLEAPADVVKFEYRRTSQTQWKQAEVTADGDGVHFTARIAPTWKQGTNEAGLTVYEIDPSTGLFADDEYTYRLTADGNEIETGTFATAAGDTIPYGDMEDSSLSCFTTANTAAPVWGSGNNQYTPQLCTQQTFPGMGGAHCAKLAGAKAPVVGILAAGNLFTGTFKREGFDGTVGFGTEYAWTARPTALKLKYHASIGRVDITKHAGAGVKVGDQDVSSLFVCVVDWESRHEVFSGVSSCSGMWSPDRISRLDEGAIIGYGITLLRESTPGDQMIEATIPIRYYDSKARPSKRYGLVISCSTSYYGDYLAGCTTNELYVDDFEWVY